MLKTTPPHVSSNVFKLIFFKENRCHINVPTVGNIIPVSIILAISSLSSDMSPIQSSIAQPLDMSPVDSCFPPKFHPVLESPSVQSSTVSQMKTTEGQQASGAPKPLVLTHLVEGFIIQEGLEPFPVNKISDSHCLNVNAVPCIKWKICMVYIFIIHITIKFLGRQICLFKL